MTVNSSSFEKSSACFLAGHRTGVKVKPCRKFISAVEARSPIMWDLVLQHARILVIRPLVRKLCLCGAFPPLQ